MNEKLQSARIKAGLTQKQVSEQIGVTERNYQNYEYGSRIPNAITVQRLASALGTTVGELFPVGEVTDSA